MSSHISHSEDDTIDIARNFSKQLKAGQAVLMKGTLGAGKTLFTRAVIRALCQDEGINVPSPTFTLCQNYETSLGTLWHYDLYRLDTPDEIYETGWEDIINQDIVIIEWPEKLQHLKPNNAITVAIEIEKNTIRKITITS